MTSRSDLYSIVFDVIEAVHADHRRSPKWPTLKVDALSALSIAMDNLRSTIYLRPGSVIAPPVEQARAAAVRVAAMAIRYLVGLYSYRPTIDGRTEAVEQDLTPPWNGGAECGGAESVTLYATGDEVFKYATLTEALHSILDESHELIAGETTVYECTFAQYDPAEAFDLDCIIDQANEKADKDIWYYNADNLFGHRISDADALHLQGLLSAWARKHASERRLKPIGKSCAIVLTEDDIKEFQEDQNVASASATEHPAHGTQNAVEFRSRSSHG